MTGTDLDVDEILDMFVSRPHHHVPINWAAVTAHDFSGESPFVTISHDFGWQQVQALMGFIKAGVDSDVEVKFNLWLGFEFWNKRHMLFFRVAPKETIIAGLAMTWLNAPTNVDWGQLAKSCREGSDENLFTRASCIDLPPLTLQHSTLRER